MAVATLAVTAAAIAATENFTIPPSSVGGAKPNCAEGKIATGGGFRSDEQTAWAHRTLGQSGRGFRVTLLNSAAEEKSGEAVAICAARDPFKVVRKRVVVELKAPGVVEKTVRARCPDNTTLAGGGSSASPAAAKIYVAQSRPVGARAWKLRTTVSGTGEFTLKAVAICDKRERVDYEVAQEKLSDQAGRRPSGRGLSVILNFELRARCTGSSHATAGGFAAIGGFSPRWSWLAPMEGDYALVGSDSWASGETPEGDIVGYAVCRK
jgi:hypothetical protein